MTGVQRREQLIGVGRALFAAKGLSGTSVEEIAAAADISKPVLYEHFGGKEGLYAVVVDRELQAMTSAISAALTAGGTDRETIERAATTLLDYIEGSPDGFRILVRDSRDGHGGGTYATLLSDVARQVENLLGDAFRQRGLDPKSAPLYAQMLVGMVSLTGQWWLEAQRPKKAEVVAHVVNLAWNGLVGLERNPLQSHG